MEKIHRNISDLKKSEYELIIIGGGIYGTMLSLEAARRGIKSILLEKDDFSSKTTLNNLRTVHGGLRYLQSADIIRFKESVKERKWFLKYLPEYVNPMPCLMPLYGKGVYRNSIFRIALTINDVLSFYRNKNLPESKKLPNGKVITAKESAEIFKLIDKKGLKGSACWYDAGVEEFQRLNMKLIHTAVSTGAEFINYFEVQDVLVKNKKVFGIIGTDKLSGETLKIKSKKIINAAGPWSRIFAEGFDKDYPGLFKKNLLLWNILFDREALSEYALGLSTRKGKKHTYFFHPWKGRLLIGTGEKIVDNIGDKAFVKKEFIEEFMNDINSIVPGISLKKSDILRVYSGILPATDKGTLAKRPGMIDHWKAGGPAGAYSISGVKFTTSRLVAEKMIKYIFSNRKKKSYKELFGIKNSDNEVFFEYNEKIDKRKLEVLKKVVNNESVIHLSDLASRRTSISDNPKRAVNAADELKKLFPGLEDGWNDEILSLKDELYGNYEV